MHISLVARNTTTIEVMPLVTLPFVSHLIVKAQVVYVMAEILDRSISYFRHLR